MSIIKIKENEYGLYDNELKCYIAIGTEHEMKYILKQVLKAGTELRCWKE